MAVFFFNDTATTEIYTLSLHDALPISVVLVMGGGLGGGDLERAVALLFEANAAMHLVVLCGSNERSRERLEKLATTEGYSATFLAFTDRVRDLMAGGTALVPQTGGTTPAAGPRRWPAPVASPTDHATDAGTD